MLAISEKAVQGLRNADVPPRLRLSDDDREIVSELRGNGILVDVQPHRISAPQGFMALLCSDCDQIADKYKFLEGVCMHHCNASRVHLFALHSGGALLSPTSPTRMGDEHEILRLHIEAAMRMKGLDLLVAGCHAPCGAAYDKGLNLYGLLRNVFEGKMYQKKHIDGLRIACFPQIDFGDQGGKQTFSISGKDFWTFAERRNIF